MHRGADRLVCGHRLFVLLLRKEEEEQEQQSRAEQDRSRRVTRGRTPTVNRTCRHTHELRNYSMDHAMQTHEI